MTEIIASGSTTITPTTSDATAAALAELQRDNAALSRLIADRQQQLDTTQRERDTFKAEVDKLTPRAKLVEELQQKVGGYEAEKREHALFEAVRPKVPGAEPLALRGVIAELHKQGRINKAPEDAAAEGEKLLKAIETDSPSFLRPPTSTGGTAGARPQQQQPPPVDPLVAAFGPRTRK